MLWAKYMAPTFPQIPQTVCKGEQNYRPKCVRTATIVDPFLCVNLSNASAESRSEITWKF